ncbi:hypothetical protein [Isoptericola haloaureus]|uniref:Secreted protein n=1 Tax=Isoptericola haloaureus TaxID=1542902 RepID=A0ABU7Z8C3_9MICO
MTPASLPISTAVRACAAAATTRSSAPVPGETVAHPSEAARSRARSSVASSVRNDSLNVQATSRSSWASASVKMTRPP